MTVMSSIYVHKPIRKKIPSYRIESKGKEPSKDQCIIHYKTVSDEDDDHLVSPQSYDSWQTLLEAAEVRNHFPIFEIAKSLEGNEVPKIFYHRRCRSLFTMKRDLKTLKRKAHGSLTYGVGSTDCTSKKPCRRSSSEGFTIQFVFFVARTNSKSDPSREKSLHKLCN